MDVAAAENRTVSLCSDQLLTGSPSLVCVLVYSFLALMSVVTVCGNLLVIVSIVYFKQLHTPTNHLLLSLAVADLLVGVLVFPLSMAFSFSSCLRRRHLLCSVRGGFDVTLSTCSVLHLCCVSVDRYHAVCRPLTYGVTVNRRVAVAMTAVSWAASALIGAAVVIGGLSECEGTCWTDVLMANTVGPILSFYLPVVVILCVYSKILLVAQRQASSIHSTRPGAAVSRLERKATRTLATVVGVFLFCWTPFFLCTTFLPLTGDSVPVPVLEALNWLTLSNSMLNPFIYAFFYSWFRAASRIIMSGKIFKGDFTNSTLN